MVQFERVMSENVDVELTNVAADELIPYLIFNE